MISILMPVYNGMQFLFCSAMSVIDQTFKDWELLIGLNGMQSHERWQITRHVGLINDKRIKVFPFKDKGKCKTLNKLVKYAKYDKICLLDIDDFWMPQKLEQQLLFVDGYDVIGTDCEYIGDKKGSPGIFLGKLETNMFRLQNPIINSSAMLKKEDAWWNEKWEGLDDYNLWIHLLRKGRTFYNVPQILTKHRIHEGSYFNNKNNDMAKKLIEEISLIDELK